MRGGGTEGADDTGNVDGTFFKGFECQFLNDDKNIKCSKITKSCQKLQEEINKVNEDNKGSIEMIERQMRKITHFKNTVITLHSVFDLYKKIQPIEEKLYANNIKYYKIQLEIYENMIELVNATLETEDLDINDDKNQKKRKYRENIQSGINSIQNMISSIYDSVPVKSTISESDRDFELSSPSIRSTGSKSMVSVN